MNQTSMVRLEVPVLPAESTLVARIGAEWPVVTISRSSFDVSHAVRGAMTGSGSLPIAAATRSRRASPSSHGSSQEAWSTTTWPWRSITRRT